ncbi:hypothetical protein ACIBHY_20315 [Nonomuraea sp. NPDC050547]|uniref:hypothetical protein n=1 Tax=unclassified Nonomuraea TaxID=2593643 RepID=UPI0037AB27A4
MTITSKLAAAGAAVAVAGSMLVAAPAASAASDYDKYPCQEGRARSPFMPVNPAANQWNPNGKHGKGGGGSNGAMTAGEAIGGLISMIVDETRMDGRREKLTEDAVAAADKASGGRWNIAVLYQGLTYDGKTIAPSAGNDSPYFKKHDWGGSLVQNEPAAKLMLCHWGLGATNRDTRKKVAPAHVYSVYIFDTAETLVNPGDGGFINWRFKGWFNREGNTVRFDKAPGYPEKQNLDPLDTRPGGQK